MDESQEVAVVVQEMVPALVSGVLFTAHPVTGRRDQALLTATWGLGEALVSGLVTPDTLTVDKATGRVLERETADKQVMVDATRAPTSAAGGTAEQPTPEAMRRAPTLSDVQAAELARLGVQIEALYGMPMDIEWALTLPSPSGRATASTTASATASTRGGARGGARGGGAGGEGAFAILQARPITALPAPEPPPPGQWKLPKGAYMAMRNNIVELMAEPLTPLFGTLGLAAVNASMHRLLDSFFGRTDVMPEPIIITVNDYAYYNGSMRIGPMARILLGSVGIARRMFSGAVERWTEVGRPRYMEAVARWQAVPWREGSSAALLHGARALTEAAIDAYGALVGGVIPAAWISEALFTMAYQRLFRRRGDPPAPTFLLGFDSAPILAEKALWDLGEWVRARSGLAAYLADAPASQIALRLDDDQPPAGVDAADWREWCGSMRTGRSAAGYTSAPNRFRDYLSRHGHAIYSLDFANPVPADDPSPVLDTLRLFISGQGANPYQRQQAAARQRAEAMQAMLGRLKGLRLRLFRKLVASAQRFAPMREDALSDVGLAYPLLRQMLRELGRRFVQGGLIQQPDDIFWLLQGEVEEAAARLDRGQALESLAEVVPQRRAVARAARRVTPPLALPQIKVMGIDLMALRTARQRRGRDNTLKGVATSPGRVTAPACVLHGPEDFPRLRAGDVLVAAITTPAWTPLFARAAAVVTDVGGPLSHGSIVAREYGIPAVLGAGVATQRIRSGQVITVDGSAGVVTLPANG